MLKLTGSRKEAVVGYALILPSLIGFLGIMIGPIIASAVLSFFDYDVMHPAKYVGMKNYVEMFTQDMLYWKSLKVTALYTILVVPLHMVGSIAIAVLMNQKIKGIRLFRTIYYLPAVLSGVAVALLWQWVFNANHGILNVALSWFGIKGPLWLSDTKFVIPAFIIMNLWTCGAGITLYLANLQGIPTQLYEAAQIDGSTPWQCFWKITLPMMSPTIFYNLIQGLIGTWQVFTPAFIMTDGGPNYSSLFYVLYLYKNGFQWLKMGYASAMAWVLFVIILLCTLLVFKSSPAWVYYESERR